MTKLSSGLKSIRLPENFFPIFLPLFIQQFLQTILGSLDVLILSYRSDLLVAAAGLANQILITSSMFLGIVEIGMTVLLTQLSEAGEEEKVKKVIKNGILLSFLFALAINLLVFTLGPQILDIMQASGELKVAALQYLRIVGASLIFQAFIGSIGAVYRSFTHVKEIMWISLAVNIINIVGNSLVILTPFPYLGEGIVGVAWATFLARLIGAFCAIILFPRLFPEQGLSGLLPQVHTEAMGKILGLGLPAGLEGVFYNVSATILMGILAYLGANLLSAKIYTETVTGYVFTISVTVAMVSQIIVGKSIGRGEKELAAKEGSNILLIGSSAVVGFMLLIALCSFYWAGLLANTEEVRLLTIKLCFWSILLEPLRCVNCCLVSSLNAAGDVRYPVIIGVISNFLLLMPLCYLFAIILEQGIIGIWLARIIDEGLRAFLFLRRWKKGDWKKIELFEKEA